MTTTIYHNSACGTSRATLSMLEEAGITPTVVNYLQQPPTRDELTALIAAAGLTVREAMRAKEPLCAQLGLDNPVVDDAALLDAMLAHPILINRPFVVTPRGVRLCRPSERVREIL